MDIFLARVAVIYVMLGNKRAHGKRRVKDWREQNVRWIESLYPLHRVTMFARVITASHTAYQSHTHLYSYTSYNLPVIVLSRYSPPGRYIATSRRPTSPTSPQGPPACIQLVSILNTTLGGS